MKSRQWDKVFLITNQFGKDNFKPDNPNTELIAIDSDFQEVSKLVQEIKSSLKDKISDFEVALNLVSGSGKEHMAVLEAVLELGLNFRLISLRSGEVEVLGLER